MSDRATLIDEFLRTAGWGAARRKPLAGDASNRRYERLQFGPKNRAVLMDADPAKGEDVAPFVHIARHLDACGLNAPEIFAADPRAGLLLLQDFGDGLYARLMADDPSCQRDLYRAAIDVLLALHQHPLPEAIGSYQPMMPDLAALAVVWYRGGLIGKDAGLEQGLSLLVQQALSTLTPGPGVLILRDYHSENLLWLPDQIGLARVGLLDFQDAMAGHAAYDLVSLTKDARRDVPGDIAREMQEYYVSQSDVDAAEFARACATVSAQRNLRILGVFARLCLRDGAAHYLDFIPRVWAYLQDDISHPALADLASFVNLNLPAPTPENLQVLRDKCSR